MMVGRKIIYILGVGWAASFLSSKVYLQRFQCRHRGHRAFRMLCGVRKPGGVVAESPVTGPLGRRILGPAAIHASESETCGAGSTGFRLPRTVSTAARSSQLLKPRPETPNRLDYPEVAAQKQADGCVLRYHRCDFRL